MTEFMIFAMLTGAGCWGFKQWLAFQERQRFMQPLEIRPREAGRVIEPAPAQAGVTEPRQLYALSQPPKPVKPAGMNKWLVMGLCALYIVCPLDFIPDFIPVLGWGDDLVAALIAFQQFLSMLFARKA